MFTKKFLILFVSGIICGEYTVFSQNMSVNTTGNPPDGSAMLDVSSVTKGLLIPRMTLAQRNAISSPATSLLIFQTDNTPGYYYNSGTPGIPVWSPVGGGTVTGSGTANYLARWTSSTALGTGVSFDNGTNVGISSTSPGARLDVVGPATGSGITIKAGGGGDVVLASGGSLFFDNNYSYAAGNYIRPYAANTQGFFTSGAERVTILSGGNVGIGSTNPGYKLTVASGAIGGNYGLLPNYAGWSAYGTGDGGAAIYNDNGTYQTLMLVGNNSAGGVRKVSVWDYLTVNGQIKINDGTQASGRILTCDASGQASWQAPASIPMYGNNAASVKLGALQSTTSGTYADIAGMSITTTTVHNTFYVFASLTARLADNSSMAQYGQALVHVRILVDGVEQAKATAVITDYDDVNGVLTSGTVSFAGVPVTIAPGSHTIKLQWNCAVLWASAPWRVEVNPTLAGVGDHCVLTIFD